MCLVAIGNQYRFFSTDSHLTLSWPESGFCILHQLQFLDMFPRVAQPHVKVVPIAQMGCNQGMDNCHCLTGLEKIAVALLATNPVTSGGQSALSNCHHSVEIQCPTKNRICLNSRSSFLLTKNTPVLSGFNFIFFFLIQFSLCARILVVSSELDDQAQTCGCHYLTPKLLAFSNSFICK